MRARLSLLLLGACVAPPPPPSPSDDPADWPVDTSVRWKPTLGEPRFIIPARGLPVSPVLPSNNNADLVFHAGRLYLAWRTSETHFASAQTRLHVMASDDLGATWAAEHTVFFETDLREPLLLSHRGRLFFQWFEAGADRFSFEPRHQ